MVGWDMLKDKMTVLKLIESPLVSVALRNELGVSYFNTVGELRAASDEVLLRGENFSGPLLKELRAVIG